jgi:hypothetical protein
MTIVEGLSILSIMKIKASIVPAVETIGRVDGEPGILWFSGPCLVVLFPARWFN